MAVTQNTYTGNGSTVLFSFTFPYLETTDIKVSVNGVNTTAYTLANPTTVQFNSAPANGAAIRIYRQTDDSATAATFYPGSAIRSQDLNDNFTQNLYVTQESTNNAATATSTANTALTNSNTAIATANGAVTTANAAASDASSALATANTASSNANSAVSTANTASLNATSAVSIANAATTTANSAATNAATAITTSNSAVTTANAATATANTAASNASAAVSTANLASTDAATAVTTANNAAATAGTAITTANGAVSTANTASATANTAISTANAAASAVASAILYTTVSTVAAIPASPANNDAVEVVNSTGIESFAPLSGKPVGFVGSSGLSVRIVYTTSGSTWNWIQYFPNDPESRYLKLSGGSLTGQLKADDSLSIAAPVYSFDGDTDTGLARTGANELALVSGGNVVLSADSSGNVDVPGTTSATNIYVQSDAVVDGALTFRDSLDITKTVSLLPSSGATLSVSYTVPSAAGTSGQILSTDGSGGLSWINPVDISAKLDASTAASTYLTIANAASTYLTSATASATYAPLASPTFTGTVTIPAGASINGYLTTASASSTYQTISGMSSYIPTSAIGTTVQSYDADTAKTDVAQTWTAVQQFASNQAYPKIPANSQTGTYTLVATDAGKHINITTGGVTIPSGVFSIGDAVTIFNNSTSSQTLTQGSSVTLRQAGTANTGNRTLLQYGVATLLCVASDTFVISGAGLS